MQKMIEVVTVPRTRLMYFLVLFFTCGSLHANDEMFSIGASLGYSQLDFVAAGNEFASVDEDNKGLMYSVNGSYHGFQVFDLKLSYFNLGEYDASIIGTVPPLSAGPEGGISFDVTGLALSLLPSRDINETLRLELEIGFLFWEASGETVSNRFSSGVFVESITASLEEDGQDLFYGVGGRLKLTDQLNGKLSINSFKIEEEKVLAISVGFDFII